MLQKPYFSQGKLRISCFEILWWLKPWYKKMHDAEARTRFSEWCSETWKSNAPQSLFFAGKIEDLVMPGIMIAHDIIWKYARRWGQSTISEKMFQNPKNACSENPIFYGEKHIFCDFWEFWMYASLLLFATVTRFRLKTALRQQQPDSGAHAQASVKTPSVEKMWDPNRD